MKTIARIGLTVTDYTMAGCYWAAWWLARIRSRLASAAGRPEGRCRECGCVEWMACQTAEGPCYWVEPDLCSACGEARDFLSVSDW